MRYALLRADRLADRKQNVEWTIASRCDFADYAEKRRIEAELHVLPSIQPFSTLPLIRNEIGSTIKSQEVPPRRTMRVPRLFPQTEIDSPRFWRVSLPSCSACRFVDETYIQRFQKLRNGDLVIFQKQIDADALASSQQPLQLTILSVPRGNRIIRGKRRSFDAFQGDGEQSEQ